MLGRPSRARNEPFTYMHICRVVTGVVWVLLFLIAQIVAINDGFVSGWGPGPDLFIVVGAAFILTAILYWLLTGVVWRWLPPDLKARLPYDVLEARQAKDGIASYRDLWNHIRHRRT